MGFGSGVGGGNPEKEKEKEDANPDTVVKKERKLEKGKITLTAEEMEAGGKGVAMPNLPKPLTLEEKKFLLAVERGDVATVKKMLTKAHRNTDYMNMNCLDPLGRGALSIAITNESLELVEMLVVMGVETKDALLQAIDAEFVEAVEVLLEHEAVIHKSGDLYSWEKVDSNIAMFTSEITPLILAAHKDNYEILKILLDRGAMLPMPHDIRCGCPECIQTSTDDSLKHSRSRINAYRALASPSLIALSSTDPILTTFELSWELKNLAITEQEFKAEYVELRYQVMNFAYELLSHTRSSTELAVILNHDPSTVHVYQEGEHMQLKRLELAIDYKQKQFVAHPNNQQLLATIWYEGLPGFRRKNVIAKCIEIVGVVVMFPAWCTMYMILPTSSVALRMRSPFMKFLVHSASYLFFLLLLILVSVRFEELVVWYLGTPSMKERLIEHMKRQRGNLPTPTECFILLYVFGFLYDEVKEMWHRGFKKYMLNMWNLMDIGRDMCYIGCLLLRILSFWQQYNEIKENPQMAYLSREQWWTFDPQLISEGFFAAANILSALKLVYIFSINPHLGPLQISLGRMVIDIVKFFFIYTLVLFAFACGLTQLLWYYNDLEKKKCYSLPNGEADWVKEGDACIKWRRFHNLFEASQSLFWASFGMVGLADFELTGIKEYTRFWSMLMFGTYCIINVIVLLNLLIAMMSSSYSFIVEHADTEWKFARTKLWMSYFELGNTLPPPFNIFPNVKRILNLLGRKSRMENLNRSASTNRRASRVRDFRYLAVMRALVWRYVRSLQKKNEERPVNEDDINEVKGDISSLRFELVDLFGANGMDVTMCAKKSKAALGRKMRIWERRLMRDFHVSPAMGNIDGEQPAPRVKNALGANKFKKVAKMAMLTSRKEERSMSSASVASQIGIGDIEHQEQLKAAMEKTRRRLDEGSPNGSPMSSRGCSPYPDLDMGPPDLLDAIKDLHLTPTPRHSPADTPMPLSPKPDGQAVDRGKLTIPGRRSKSHLKDSAPQTDMKIDIPPINIFSPTAMNELKKYAKNTPVTLATENEKPSAPEPKPQPKIAPPIIHHNRAETQKSNEKIEQHIEYKSLEGMDIVRKPKRQISLDDDLKKDAKHKEQPARLVKQDSKDSVPVMMVTPSTPAPHVRKELDAPPNPQQTQCKTPPPPKIPNTPPSDGLENTDVVRRPKKSAAPGAPEGSPQQETVVNLEDTDVVRRPKSKQIL
ncbi:unnamed protein product [Meganyctiphanes norvegica]|uniref:Transient receptor ion channel domain-containing protein n=1 Tax=Meganyctiphanes norvegica TaxID=48144 RepID=A0AAV2PU10_MEGNR